MAHVKLQDGGWCALPESLRQQLDLKTGQAFEVELVGGTIVLKRAETTRAREALPAVADEKLSGPIVDPALAVTFSLEMPDDLPEKGEVLVRPAPA